MTSSQVKAYNSYKECDLEWLHTLPDSWGTKRLKDILYECVYGTSDKTRENGKYEVLGMGEIEDGRVSFPGIRFVDFIQAELLLKKGDLLFNRTNSLALVGKVGLIEHSIEDTTFASYLIRLRLSKNNTSKFYWYFLNSENFLGYSRSNAIQTANQANLSSSKLKQFKVVSISLDTQRAIATYLDTKTAQIDRKIDLLTQKNQRYEELKQSLINKTVTRGLDETVPMKDSGIEWIGDIPEHWAIHRIKDFTYVKGRIGWQGLRSSDFLDTGDYYCVTGTDLIDGSINWSGCYFVSKDRYEQDKYIQLKVGDLLITKDGTIGKIAIVDELFQKATLNSGLFVTRPLKGKYLNVFLYWVLNSLIFRNYIDLNKGGSTIQHLYQNVFDRFLYCCPPLIEQKEISNYLFQKINHVDQIIQNINIQIKKQKELRKTLINDVVTGKIKAIDN